MRAKKFISFFVLLFLILVNNVAMVAQCAMCKTSVESDLKNGGSIAKGLNSGILYLMAIPYVILMLGAYFFFRKQINLRIRLWRDKHFGAKPSH